MAEDEQRDKGGRPRALRTLDEVGTNPALFMEWSSWKTRMTRIAKNVYGSAIGGKEIGIDLFGTSEAAAETRQPKRGDSMMLRVLKELAIQYHAAEDVKTQIELLKRMEPLSHKIDVWIGSHFEQLPKLVLDVRRQAQKDREHELELAKLGAQSAEEAEAELLDMFDGDDEAMQSALDSLEQKAKAT